MADRLSDEILAELNHCFGRGAVFNVEMAVYWPRIYAELQQLRRSKPGQSDVERMQAFLVEHNTALCNYALLGTRDFPNAVARLLAEVRSEQIEKDAGIADKIADKLMKRAEKHHKADEYERYEELECHAGVADEVASCIRSQGEADR